MYEFNAHFYDFFEEAGGPEPETEFLLRHLAGRSPLLEIGSGTGTTAIRLAERGRVVYCVEPSDAMRAIMLDRMARRPELHPRLTVVKGDQATGLGMRFDGAFACNVLHIVDEETRRGILSSMARHLNPGGIAVLDLRIDGPVHDAPLRLTAKRRIGEVEYQRLSGVRRVPSRGLEVTWVFREVFRGSTLHETSERFLVATEPPEAIGPLMEGAGLKIAARYAGYEGDRPYEDGPGAKMVIVATKP